MPLPDSIPVRYTEEEAGYVTVRPVVRQTFRLAELLDMIVSVTGKDSARVRQILKTGTVVYHFYRYWWTGFDADEAEIHAALSKFPDSDASRRFSGADCTTAIFESVGANPRVLLELDRATGTRRRLFRGKNFWEGLLEIAEKEKAAYQNYSYSHRADLYRLELTQERSIEIARAARMLAPRKLRLALQVLLQAGKIVFVCPRGTAQIPTKDAEF